jgi:dTDP-4-dehydrorhamnose 3,5-epimerase
MPLMAIATGLPEVMILEPKVFGDERGFFFESFNARDFEQVTGLKRVFVQDNHSSSARGVLRGLHYPEGFAHGFLVTSESAEVLYKTTDYWYPEDERSLLWNDPTIGIEWPVARPPQLAPKDAAAKRLDHAELY